MGIILCNICIWYMIAHWLNFHIQWLLSLQFHVNKLCNCPLWGGSCGSANGTIHGKTTWDKKNLANYLQCCERLTSLVQAPRNSSIQQNSISISLTSMNSRILEVLTALLMRLQVFWAVMPCRMVRLYVHIDVLKNRNSLILMINTTLFRNVRG
jgi:predicted Rdx family selenoprotein